MMHDHAPNTLRIATYNIHSGIGTDRRYDPHRTAAVLAEIGADIFGLQEVDSRRRPGRAIDQFELFERSTGYHSVAGPNVVLGMSKYGNAILSRWPIRHFVLHDLSIAGCEPRGAIEAEIDVEGVPLRVVNTHFGLRRHERRRQILHLAELLGHGPRLPTVVMGDFNFWGRHGGALRVLGHPAPLPDPTFPSRYPVLRLDRIWTRPPGLCSHSVAHRTPLARRASDHLPLVATVSHPRAPRSSLFLPSRFGVAAVAETGGRRDEPT